MYAKTTVLAAVGLSAIAIVSAAHSRPVVNITNGTIEGGACSDTNVNYFIGIPYATPPVSDLRFTPPQPYNGGFNGTLKATTAAPSCPQFGVQAIERGPQSEDCLYLDIWAPANATSDANLPVKVWLYGGGDESGGISDPLYQGCYLANDAVVVTVNYRLGPLGFLALEQANLTGNYGIQDELLALQWVQENVAPFGGDPTKVLLFGQSAGAFDTFVISTLPQAPGLIRAAIMESGGGVDFATVAEAQTFNELFVAQLNCSVTDITCLQSVSPDTMNKAYLAVVNATQPDVPVLGSLLEHDGRSDSWNPLVDGNVIPTQPSQVGVKVPSIFGSNANEGTLFVIGQYSSGALSLNSSVYDEFLTYLFGPFSSTINQTYPVSEYSSSSSPVFAAISAVITDYGFRCPAYRGLLGAAQNGVPAYTYFFNHTPSCSWESALGSSDQLVQFLGPTHSAEIPFVFGMVDNLPPPSGSCKLSSAEKSISTFMMNAWTSMASSGTPGDESDWPTFNSTLSQGINVQDSRAVVGTVDYSVCLFWDNIAAGVFQLDANSTTSTSGTTSGVPTTSSPSPSTTTHHNLAAGPLRGSSKHMLVYTASALLFFAL